MRIEDWDTGQWVVWVYRRDPSTGRLGNYLLQQVTPIKSPDEIRSQLGGGNFVIFLKEGPSIRARLNLDIEGPPKAFNGAGAPGSVAAAPPSAPVDGATQIGLKALEMQSFQPEAMRGMFGVMFDLMRMQNTAAIEAIKAQIPQPEHRASFLEELKLAREAGLLGSAPNAPNQDPLVTRLLETAVTKMLNPGGSSIKETLDLVSTLKDSGLMGGGEGRVSLVAEITRQLPSLMDRFTSVAESWAKGKQAEADFSRNILISQGKLPPAAALPPPPGKLATMPAPGARPAAPNPPANAAPNPQQVVSAFIEERIVALIRDEKSTPHDAAGEAITFLDVAQPGLVDMLAKGSPEQIIAEFSKSPILGQVKDHPRLLPFLQELIRQANEEETPAATDPPVN